MYRNVFDFFANKNIFKKVFKEDTDTMTHTDNLCLGMALVYSFHDSMISGARYHRVATYLCATHPIHSDGREKKEIRRKKKEKTKERKK